MRREFYHAADALQHGRAAQEELRKLRITIGLADCFTNAEIARLAHKIDLAREQVNDAYNELRNSYREAVAEYTAPQCK